MRRRLDHGSCRVSNLPVTNQCMLLSLSLFAKSAAFSLLTESEGQPQPSRDLIDVVNVLPQYGSVVAAPRVVAFNDLDTNAIKGFIVQALKVLLCQGDTRELFRSFLASRIIEPCWYSPKPVDTFYSAV